MTTVSVEEAAFLRSTGPGTPMGRLFRRFWHPVLLSSDLPRPDGDPVRVTILWEDLVAFRDSSGRVGLLNNACPHRNMPLSDGLNANGRLTCRYHAWAFDVTGRCVDDQPGADSVLVRVYPTMERGGIIWAYLGPADRPPPSPAVAVTPLAADQIVVTRTPVRGTYLKTVGEHIDAAVGYAGDGYAAMSIEDTAAGFRLVAHRVQNGGAADDDIACHLLPTHTVISTPAMTVDLIAVPVDAWTSMRFAIAGNPDRPFTAAERQETISRGPLPSGSGVEPAVPLGGGAATAPSPPAAALVERLRRRLIASATGP
jgi:nitrite reductase/ring-hydroxylating ferredoxin subunit